MAVQGGSGIKLSIDDILPDLKFNKNQNPRLVHRLDKDTSGILLIAINRQSADILTLAFKNKQIEKTYIAVVKGKPSQKSGVIDLPLIKKFQGKNEKIYVDKQLGKQAITYYKILKYNKKLDCSLLELKPITGRTHQLRVHLKEIGHVIIGDYKYGGKNANIQDNTPQNSKNRLQLHATRIVINDFFEKKLTINTPIPDDFIIKT